MPNFVHPLLLWGLAIAAVPVLIHLINMMRHRRVEWAAMEFLLISQKKHRTWVILKQLLLLLLRMLAIAAMALLVAQPLLNNRLSRIFGRVKTHHVILLDDSYSMSDRWDDTSAFQEAKKVIERIGGEAAKQIQPQSVTLLRFSRVGKSGRPTQTDFLNEQVVTGFHRPAEKVARQVRCLAIRRRARRTAQGARRTAGRSGRRTADPLRHFRFPHAAVERSGRREKTAAQMAGRRSRYPSDRLHRPGAAESVDRFLAARGRRSRGGRAVVHGSGGRQSRPDAR